MKRREGQDTSRGLSNPPPPPILFTCLNSLKGALCVLMRLGDRGSRKKGTPIGVPPSRGQTVNRQKEAKSLQDSYTSPLYHLVQTCLTNSCLFFRCGFCCQSVKLEGTCQNSLPRNSVLTLNAAVSNYQLMFGA